MREEKTLNKIQLNEEVIIKKINCERKYKQETYGFGTDRRNENKTSI